MASTGASVFEEGLRLAADVEGAEQGADTLERVQSSDTASTSGLDDNITNLLHLLGAKQEHSQLLAQAGRQRDHLAAATMVDSSMMQQMAVNLGQAAATLRQVVADRATLAVQLKDLNSKQTIGIEPHLQKQFLALLLEAAKGTRGLEGALPSLQWAVQCTEPPASWEQHLHALSLAISQCSSYHAQLEARASALSQYASIASGEAWLPR